MGIFCEMNLFKPPGEVYKPGQVVAGVIKYSVDAPMAVDKIIVSLKGLSIIIISENAGSRNERNFITVQGLIDIDNIIQDQRSHVAVGSYEVRFNYVLPHNIPSSLKLEKYFHGYRVKCLIVYYIRIKFDRPLFAFNKHYRKEIPVIADAIATLAREPVIYGENKKIRQLFSSKDSAVKIKATIPISIFPFGGKIEVHYQVENNSHVAIKSITTKLVESFIFKAKGYPKVFCHEDLPTTEAKTVALKSKETQTIAIVIDIPQGKYNIQNSEMVCRHYYVKIIAQLPFPHRNVMLDIPVEIGVRDGIDYETRLEEMYEDVNYNDLPPSYWASMGEANEDSLDFDDDSKPDKNKGEK